MVARRSFLSSLAAPFAARAAAPAGFVASDVGRLKRVLVHTPGPEVRKGLGLGYGPPRFLGGGIDERAGEDHLAMIAALRRSGAEVVTFEAALDEAVKEARAARQLVPWLRGWAPQLAPRQASLTGAALLGAVDELVYHSDPDGNFLPLSDPAASIYWTRDSAVMTPRGVALCHFMNEGRWNESVLMRFAYEWSPTLRRYPIVFDAAEEQCTMEGGDVTVFDARTLFVGVGNRTSETAARRLARRLEMDVIAVQMPSTNPPPKRGDATPRTPLHNTFLHFDTVCTFVDQQTAVTVPFFFEKEYAGKDPLTRMMRGLARLPKVDEAAMERNAAVLRDLGKVRRYKAGSGELDSSLGELKLVDYLKSRGVRIVHVGGPVPPAGVEKHVAERLLFELRRQAANTVAVAPGRVLSYAGNPHTQKALEEAGVAVETFPGGEIMRNNGGPHCLTQPLERAE